MSSPWARPTRIPLTDRCKILAALDRVPGGSSGGSGRGGCRRVRHRNAGHRYRRIDSAARLVLRRGRSAADLRTRFALRADRLRLVARSGRSVRDLGGDAATMLREIAGQDPMDATSSLDRSATMLLRWISPSLACGLACRRNTLVRVWTRRCGRHRRSDRAPARRRREY